jgi:hypothetical protein
LVTLAEALRVDVTGLLPPRRKRAR